MKEYYGQQDIYADLLENASKLLRPGGRIVFLWHAEGEDTSSAA
jgi:23S rRNA G2069 N7-methylase RlmK/C1962 C5-methylase RlmI